MVILWDKIHYEEHFEITVNNFKIPISVESNTAHSVHGCLLIAWKWTVKQCATHRNLECISENVSKILILVTCSATIS